MADLITTIIDWRTNDADNKPGNADEIDGTTTPGSDYVGVGNAIRDTKGVIRSESLNLGWDPASSITINPSNIANVTISTVLSTSSEDADKATLSISYQAGSWKRCTEGQTFVLRIQTGTSPVNYAYYTGYISAIRNMYDGSKVPQLCQISCSGMYRWTEDSSNAAFLVREAAVVFTNDDLDKLGDSTDTNNVTLDFSAYPPTQNQLYTKPSLLVNRNTGFIESLSSQNSASDYRVFEQSTLPRRRQCGQLLMSKTTWGVNTVLSGNLIVGSVGKWGDAVSEDPEITGYQNPLTAVFPYPEPDTDYVVSITPTFHNLTYGGDQDKFAGCFTIKSVKKSRSFFTVEFVNTPADTTLPIQDGKSIQFDWEISRSY